MPKSGTKNLKKMGQKKVTKKGKNGCQKVVKKSEKNERKKFTGESPFKVSIKKSKKTNFPKNVEKLI